MKITFSDGIITINGNEGEEPEYLAKAAKRFYAEYHLDEEEQAQIGRAA